MASEASASGTIQSVRREVRIAASDGAILYGDFDLPEHAAGVVVFAHGSGSNRHSPRNRHVARRFREARIATLLVDLLTRSEADDIIRDAPELARLAQRVIDVTSWLELQSDTTDLPVAYFGASTGAAVALIAAAAHPSDVVAVVSRGGRPDLVPPEILARVEAPCLFMVGSLDTDVLTLNRRALRHIRSEREIEVIPGASHLFEEPGTLESVAEHATSFILRHFSSQSLATRFVIDGEEPELEAREDSIGSYQMGLGRAVFEDRAHAGRELARALERLRDERPLVLGVPRGGVPVAFEVARHLDAELDVVVARKLGAPGREELAIGAVTADGVRYVNDEIVSYLGVSDDYLDRVTLEQSAEARRRERRFRQGLPPLEVAGRTAIIVDDGVATGATLRAVARSLRHAHVGRLIIAAPVGSAESCEELEDEADEVVCLKRPEPFYAVGLHYRNFGQTSDEQVEQLIREARAAAPPQTGVRSVGGRLQETQETPRADAKHSKA